MTATIDSTNMIVVIGTTDATNSIEKIVAIGSTEMIVVIEMTVAIGSIKTIDVIGLTEIAEAFVAMTSDASGGTSNQL